MTREFKLVANEVPVSNVVKLWIVRNELVLTPAFWGTAGEEFIKTDRFFFRSNAHTNGC